MIEWLKQQYNNLIFELFPILPSYLVRDCYKEFDEKYKEFRIMTENKRYVRILDHSEKEVRIFDKNNQKNIFNIFFMGLDSAICLKGALEDTVDLLNELNDTNQELYDFRLVLNALLFNEWAENKKYEVYKSKRHSDGELCFEGEWFVVVAILPTGQVTNHYHIKYWDYFKIPSFEKVKDEFDGHTSTDVLIRYGLMLND